jgi:hypothetical protein
MPPGNIWTLPLAAIMNSNTVLGDLVRALYEEEKKKIALEKAQKEMEEKKKKEVSSISDKM